MTKIDQFIVRCTKDRLTALSRSSKKSFGRYVICFAPLPKMMATCSPVGHLDRIACRFASVRSRGGKSRILVEGRGGGRRGRLHGPHPFRLSGGRRGSESGLGACVDLRFEGVAAPLDCCCGIDDRVEPVEVALSMLAGMLVSGHSWMQLVDPLVSTRSEVED